MLFPSKADVIDAWLPVLCAKLVAVALEVVELNAPLSTDPVGAVVTDMPVLSSCQSSIRIAHSSKLVAHLILSRIERLLMAHC